MRMDPLVSVNGVTVGFQNCRGQAAALNHQRQGGWKVYQRALTQGSEASLINLWSSDLGSKGDVARVKDTSGQW